MIGSRGRIIAPNAFLPGNEGELVVEIDGKTEREPFHGVNQWMLEFEHLSRSILDGTSLDFDTEDAIKQQRALDAVYRSTRSGQVETV